MQVSREICNKHKELFSKHILFSPPLEIAMNFI